MTTAVAAADQGTHRTRERGRVCAHAWWGWGWGHLEGGLELGLLDGERIREGFGLGGAFAALGLPHTLGRLRLKERTGTEPAW